MASDILTSSQAGRAAALTVSTHSLTIAAAVPSSQHVADAFQHRNYRPPRLFSLEDRPRHSVGREHIAPRRLPEAHGSLQTQVFETVKQRLQRSDILIGDLDHRFFAFLLPKHGASSSQWSKFIDDPMFVATDQLRDMFTLQRSIVSTSRASGPTTFYVRTFTFTFRQLRDVLEHIMGESAKHESQAYNLLERVMEKLDPFDDATAPVYIRYCGATGEGTPWRRHQTDLYQCAGKKSFLSMFLYICLQNYPEIIAAAEILQFSDATISIPLDRQRQHIADVREQALIALFDLDTLLNTLPGGYSLTPKPDSTDEVEFLQLRTRCLTYFGRYADPCSAAIQQAIDCYARTCQRYTQKHPVTTKSKATPLDDTMVSVMAEQATPSLLATRSGSYSIILSIGCDIPRENMQDHSAFYGGKVMSGRVIMDILDNFAFGELGYRSYLERPVLQLQRCGHLPFVDLYPWAAKHTDDYESALAMLRKYLLATRPIIVLSFGELVSRTAVSYFQDKSGISARAYTKSVGGVFMSRYDNATASNDDANCCLVIPCIHPGMVARTGSRNAAILRFIDKVLAKVWLATSLAFEITKTDTQWDGTKRDLCERIRQEVDAKCGPTTSFGRLFEESRKQYWKQTGGEKITQTPGQAAAQPISRAQDEGTVPGALPPSFFNGRQEPFQMAAAGSKSKKAKTLALTAQLPFRPGDAGWLFHKFLEESYPNGGKVYLFHHEQGDGKLRTLPSMWDDVESFLSKPLYIHHPHYNALQVLVELSKDTTKNRGHGLTGGITTIISVLRPPVTSRPLEDRMGTVRRSITTLEIGATVPSNTIVGDVFAQDVDEALRQSLASQRRAQIRPSSSIDQGRKRVAEDQGQGKQDEQVSKRVKVAGNDRRRWIDDEDDEEMLV